MADTGDGKEDYRNPSALLYSFTVNGIRYEGADYSGEGGNSSYGQLHPGDLIFVTYYLVGPRVYSACDPTLGLNELQQIESSFGVVTGIPGGFVVALRSALAAYLYTRSKVVRGEHDEAPVLEPADIDRGHGIVSTAVIGTA